MPLSAVVRRVGASLAEAPASARGVWSHRSGAILRLEASDGATGFGEASPLPGFSPDLLHDALSALAQVPWSRTPTLPTLGDIGRFVEEHLPATLPSARFAAETALADLEAKRRGTSLASFLGAPAARCLPLSGVITALDPNAALERARGLHADGVGAFKVKIGRPDGFDAELRILSLLRETFPDAILRGDANGALDPVSVVERLARLAELGVSSIEEPVGLDQLERVLPLPIPVALDESLAGRTHDVLDQRGLGAVVLKPTLLGGFSPVIGWARAARERGLDVIVSHTFDGPLALTAASHLALAIATETPQGLAPHTALAAFPDSHLPLHRRGRLLANDVLGLGAQGPT